MFNLKRKESIGGDLVQPIYYTFLNPPLLTYLQQSKHVYTITYLSTYLTFICFLFSPDREDEEAWYRFILTNFERHYLGSRAPFGFFIHEWYLSTYPAVYRAMERFLNLVNSLNDAFMVSYTYIRYLFSR